MTTYRLCRKGTGTTRQFVFDRDGTRMELLIQGDPIHVTQAIRPWPFVEAVYAESAARFRHYIYTLPRDRAALYFQLVVMLGKTT